ncbi:hypothetical protein PAL_GLEAN10002032 [Pteropus alecto]|uniref:Uncharacterized protein n=1 Tax=Pteropus alecto TaxID=9402 RepID=L5KFV1_PTEAL|nr:hypothetical protein PAL_GLEAN10002032 [Pteropus alecto]
MLEPNVPTAHRETADRVVWMFLAANLEIQNQAQQVHQLQCQEEALKKWLVAVEFQHTPAKLQDLVKQARQDQGLRIWTRLALQPPLFSPLGL